MIVLRGNFSAKLHGKSGTQNGGGCHKTIYYRQKIMEKAPQN